MMGRLHVDLFIQDRFLRNGVSVKIRLEGSKETVSLMEGSKEGRKENLYLAEYTYKLMVFTIQLFQPGRPSLRPPCGRYRDGHHNTKIQTHNYIN